MSQTGWAVVTGASGGIGEALAWECARDGYDCLLTARDSGGLRRVARDIENRFGVKTLVQTADLSDPKQANKLYQFAQQRKLNVAILINNAGFGDYAPLDKADWQKVHNMIELNVSSLIRLTQLFGPGMKKGGKVLNLASTAAFVPGPKMAVYYASKAFVLNFSLAINQEWKQKGISVTALCPGPTQTNFAKASHATSSNLFRGKLPSADAVARYGYKAMQKGKPVAIHGWRNKLMIFSTRFVPRHVLARIVARVQG